MSADTCPGCRERPGTHLTDVRPGLKLCAGCFARMIAAVREGRP